MQDFLRNNRGINDGGDLPEEFMTSLYERIQTNEIKMKVAAAAHCLTTNITVLLAAANSCQSVRDMLLPACSKLQDSDYLDTIVYRAFLVSY